MSLLTLVQAACARLGLPNPATAFTNAEENIRVMVALATQEGRELARRATWQRLVKEQTFTTVALEVQAGAVPADFDRFVPDTVWNYTEREPMLGPLEPNEWQELKAGLVGPPDLYYRRRGNDFLILPAPPAGQEIRFEYVSTRWVDTDGDGVGDATAWAADENEALLDEELLTLGVVWRWLKGRRLPYVDEFNEYQVQVQQAIARDGGKRVLRMGGRMGGDGPRYPRVPDGSWNI